MTELLVRTPDNEEEFAMVERMDDEQILKAMTKGAIIEKLVYNFKAGGEEIYDLSWAGIKMVAQLFGNIHCELVEKTILDGTIFVIYSAHDISRNIKLDGAAQQDMKLQGGKVDNFALAKAVSKAERNAIKHTLMQIPLYQQLLTFFVQHERMKEEDMLRIIIPENIDKYGFDYNKVLDYCNEQFNKETLDDMALEELKKLSSVLVIKQGKDLFTKGE